VVLYRRIHSTRIEPARRMIGRTPPMRSFCSTHTHLHKIYFPPNQLEIPLLAFEAPSSTLRSAASIFFNASLLASLLYCSSFSSALATSLRALSVCSMGLARAQRGHVFVEAKHAIGYRIKRDELGYRTRNKYVPHHRALRQLESPTSRRPSLLLSPCLEARP
jgi:hypothetical protein